MPGYASYAARTRSAVAPSQLDLSSEMPPIADQHETQACTAFSSSYAILTYYEELLHGSKLTGNGEFGIDTAHVFSPAYVWNSLNGGQNVGLNPADVARFLKKHGGVPWRDFPWTGKPVPKPGEMVLREGRPFHLARYFKLPRDRNAVKTYLQAGYPIFWAVHVDKSLDGLAFADATASLPAWQPDASVTGKLGGHAMVIVGYDDTQGGFIFRNSWGTNFGNAGYALIPYATFESKHITALSYVLEPAGASF